MCYFPLDETARGIVQQAKRQVAQRNVFLPDSLLLTEGVTAGELLIPALLGRWALLHLAAKFYLKVHFAIWQLWGRGGGGGGDADGDGDGRVGENIY